MYRLHEKAVQRAIRNAVKGYRKDIHTFPQWSTSNSQVMKRHAPLPPPRDFARFSPHYPKHFPRHCYFSAHPDRQANRSTAVPYG